jgi:hypothetical protein
MYYVRKLDVNKVSEYWKLLIPEPPIKDWKLMVATTSRTLK